MAEVEAKWPSKCMTCQKFLKTNGFAAEKLKNTIAGLKEQVTKDIETVNEFLALKPLGKKRRQSESSSTGAPSSAKGSPDQQNKVEVSSAKGSPDQQNKVEVKSEVKEEHGVKEEGEVPQPRRPEEVMSKAELCDLHRLVILPRKSQGKAHPVKCNICDVVFEGRNRAKVYQHITAAAHRRKWKNKSCEVVGHAKPSAIEETHDMSVGQCRGLRLGSSIGALTRLGNDLRPAWETFSKFAYLERTGSACFLTPDSMIECFPDDWWGM